MTEKLLLIGGGGHAKAVLDIVEQLDGFDVGGIIDLKENVGKTCLGVPIVGTDDDLLSLRSTYSCAFVSVGSVGDSSLRKSLFNMLDDLDFDLPNLVSPTAYVSPHVEMGRGNLIMHGAVVNVCATLGDNNVINSCALVEHDVTMGDHNYVSTGAIINGNVTLKNNVFVGSHATVNQTICIQDDIIVGSQALVTKSLNESGVYYGVPVERR